eukprot:3870816-Rhodomonas_salina.2
MAVPKTAVASQQWRWHHNNDGGITTMAAAPTMAAARQAKKEGAPAPCMEVLPSMSPSCIRYLSTGHP